MPRPYELRCSVPVLSATLCMNCPDRIVFVNTEQHRLFQLKCHHKPDDEGACAFIQQFERYHLVPFGYYRL